MGDQSRVRPLHRAGRALDVSAGARLDHSDQFGSFGTARAGMSWQLLAGVRLHGALGTGFKEPTFLETYATGFARGNPALEPEQSPSAEVGVSAEAGRVDVALTAVRQTFRNLVQYTFTPPAADAPNYFNMGKARAEGLELELGAALGRGVRASGSYTGLRTTVLDAGFGEDRQFLEGEPLLRRPGARLHGTLAWQHGPLVATLGGDYTGARADLDFTDAAEWQGRRVELPAYATADATLGYTRARSWGTAELALRVRNLADARYQEVYNFPAPGRLVSLGVRLAR